MKKIDTWLDIQRYVEEAVRHPVRMGLHEDIEFIAHLRFPARMRTSRMRRQFRRLAV
jgi:hypothetical protein